MPSDYEKFREEQRKYHQSKKEALQARKEKWHKPKPSGGDPPVPSSPPYIWIIAGMLVMVTITGFLTYSPQAAPASSDELELWIQGSQEEYNQLHKWVTRELVENNLDWHISYLQNADELYSAYMTGGTPDLLLVKEDLARTLFDNGSLAPLQDKRQAQQFDEFFDPLWESRPWLRQIGWAIPAGSRLHEARHLYTVISLFADPFPQPWID